MSRLAVGVMGHVDHGKTALVRAITGIDTDRLPEEKLRGISIALGFAHFRANGTEIDLIDMPGHERFVRTMVAGASGVGAALLVVAANEGVKPQTIEHLEISALLGLGAGAIAVTKTDLVDRAAADAVGEAAAGLATTLGISIVETVLTSAVDQRGLKGICDALGRCATDSDAVEDRGYAYLPIDRAFTIPGHGTIVTGTLRGGSLRIDEDVEIAPALRTARVRAMQVHGSACEAATPGQRVAVNLRGIEPGEVGRGHALITPGLFTAFQTLSVELRTAPSIDGPLKSNQIFRLLFGTTEVNARLRLLDEARLGPGGCCLAQLHCERPVIAPVGERFVLQRLSPSRVVGGGRILVADAARLRCNNRAQISRLAALSQHPPQDAVLVELESAGQAGRTLRQLVGSTGFGPGRIREYLQAIPHTECRGELFLLRQHFDALAESIPPFLERWRKGRIDGPNRDQIRREIGAVPHAAALDAAISALIARGVARHDGPVVRLVNAPEDAERERIDGELAARLIETLREAHLAVPSVKTLRSSDPHAPRILSSLIRKGVLIRAIDRVQRRELIFHRDAIEWVKSRLQVHLGNAPGLLVGEIGELLGVSRKYSIPLVEHLDYTCYTIRIGDRRILRDPSGSQQPR